MTNNFAVIIPTHKRPKVKTTKTLQNHGYTGRIVYLLDNLDPTREQYEKNYGKENIYVFDKAKAHQITDSADNTGNMKAVVYARNVCFDVAKELGLTHFIVLDDDYSSFNYKSNAKHTFGSWKINSLNGVFAALVRFLDATPTTCVAMAQGGDFIGGFNGTLGKKIMLRRKVMNSFVCKTDRPFQFYGLINEDVNMYVVNGQRGELHFTTTQLSLEQGTTQQNSGGLTDIYLELGTYVKSFYSVLYAPACVKIKAMGTTHPRLHHSIDWDVTAPRIIRETYKKDVKHG